MSDAVQVISAAESPEQDTGRAEEQFCFVGPSTFSTNYVAYRTVVQTLCVDTRSYGYGGDTTRLGDKDVCTGAPAGLDERVEDELRY